MRCPVGTPSRRYPKGQREPLAEGLSLRHGGVLRMRRSVFTFLREQSRDSVCSFLVLFPKRARCSGRTMLPLARADERAQRPVSRWGWTLYFPPGGGRNGRALTGSGGRLSPGPPDVAVPFSCPRVVASGAERFHVRDLYSIKRRGKPHAVQGKHSLLSPT